MMMMMMVMESSYRLRVSGFQAQLSADLSVDFMCSSSDADCDMDDGINSLFTCERISGALERSFPVFVRIMESIVR